MKRLKTKMKLNIKINISISAIKPELTYIKDFKIFMKFKCKENIFLNFIRLKSFLNTNSLMNKYRNNILFKTIVIPDAQK